MARGHTFIMLPQICGVARAAPFPTCGLLFGRVAHTQVFVLRAVPLRRHTINYFCGGNYKITKFSCWMVNIL